MNLGPIETQSTAAMSSINLQIRDHNFSTRELPKRHDVGEAKAVRVCMHTRNRVVVDLNRAPIVLRCVAGSDVNVVALLGALVYHVVNDPDQRLALPGHGADKG